MKQQSNYINRYIPRTVSWSSFAAVLFDVYYIKEIIKTFLPYTQRIYTYFKCLKIVGQININNLRNVSIDRYTYY